MSKPLAGSGGSNRIVDGDDNHEVEAGVADGGPAMGDGTARCGAARAGGGRGPVGEMGGGG